MGTPRLKLSALVRCSRSTMELPLLLLHRTEVRAGVRGTGSPREAREGAASAFSTEPLATLAGSHPGHPLSSSPSSLTSPCASSTVFMNTAIPIAAVLIVSTPFSSALGWGGGRWSTTQVPGFYTGSQKLCPRVRVAVDVFPPHPTQTGPLPQDQGHTRRSRGTKPFTNSLRGWA